MMWFKSLFLSYLLKTITLNGASFSNQDIGSGPYLCEGTSCPVFECGQTEDCDITCGNSYCEYMTIKVYNNNINITCIGDCTYLHIIAYNTNSFTFTGGAKFRSTITTYGIGNVTINFYRPYTNLFLNGYHENVEINIDGWWSALLSAINVKNLNINILSGNSVKMFLPISSDSVTTINDESPSNNIFGLFALQGLSTINFQCGGADGICIGKSQLYLFYGKDYNSLCDIYTNECTALDTSIGNSVDNYTFVYADSTISSVDFRNDNDNKFVFWPFGDNTPRTDTLYGPNSADIILICLGNVYGRACNGVSFDFSLSNNAIVGSGDIQKANIVGPRIQFDFYGYYATQGDHNNFTLENTQIINIKSYSDDRFVNNNGFFMQFANIYVGNNGNMNIVCDSTHCNGAVIYSTVDPYCTPLKHNWIINPGICQANPPLTMCPDGMTVEFKDIGVTCTVTPDNTSTCDAYFKTNLQVDTNINCTATSSPTTSNPTTSNPTTSAPTTSTPTTSSPTTSTPTTSAPTTSNPTTSNPTTSTPTTSAPTTSTPTTSSPTTSTPTTSNPTTSIPTTSNPTTSNPTTSTPTTLNPTTSNPTTSTPTTSNPTTSNPTSHPTTSNPTTPSPTGVSTTEVFDLVLDGDFNDLLVYLDENDVEIDTFALNTIETLMNVGADPNIIINIIDVFSGSIIINYSLTSNDIQLLNESISNIDSSLDNDYIFNDLTFKILSNHRIITLITEDVASNAYKSKNILLMVTLIVVTPLIIFL